MSLEEEQEFLSQWEAKASEGGVLTVPPIHAALVKRLGYEALHVNHLSLVGTDQSGQSPTGHQAPQRRSGKAGRV